MVEGSADRKLPVADTVSARRSARRERRVSELAIDAMNGDMGAQFPPAGHAATPDLL